MLTVTPSRTRGQRLVIFFEDVKRFFRKISSDAVWMMIRELLAMKKKVFCSCFRPFEEVCSRCIRSLICVVRRL